MTIIYQWVLLAFFGLVGEKAGIPENNHTKFTQMDLQDPEIWKKIDSLLNRGLDQSADALLSGYMNTVDPEKQPFEWVKTRAYKARFLFRQSPEFNANDGFKYLSEETEKISGPAKAVMNSLQAEMYFAYFNTNMHTISQRTSVERDRPDDINDWTGREFMAKTSELFSASIKDPLYRSIPIDSCKAILTQGVKSEKIVSNLYEFLLLRALEFYYDNRSSLTEPVYAFNPDAPEYFGNFRAFNTIKIDSADKSSNLLFALQTHQKHQSIIQENQDLLLYLELKRLKALRQASSNEDRDSLYMSTLRAYANEYESNHWYSEFIFEIASVIVSEGNNYLALDSTTFKFRWLKKDAVELLAKAIEKYPDSYGAQLCSNLLQSIKQPSVNFEIENFILPDKSFPLHIKFKEVKDISGSIYSLKYDEWESYNRMNLQDRVSFFAARMPTRKFETSLPSTDDFQSHVIEYKMDPLNAGIYVVMFDSNSEEHENSLYYQLLTISVSEIDYITRQSENSQEVWVSNRNTGCPQPEATIVLEERTYDRRSTSSTRTFQTDKNGYAKVPLNKNASTSLRIWYEDSNILPYSAWSYNYETKPENRVLFFTDRSIYRPGQTVYFKLLDYVLDKNRVPDLRSKRSIDVQLRDPNNQMLANVVVKTNEYGSASGSFRLPESGLTGVFRISEKDSWTSTQTIRMEEYKRPRFFVEMEDPAVGFKLGDTVRLSGQAMMYAGVPVDAAEVTYRVTRTVEFPWLPWFRFPRNPEPEAIIALGSTKSDAEGNFEMEFVARSGKSPVSTKPVYRYQVHVDITDQAGETRSTVKSISIGTSAYQASISVPQSINKRDLKEIGFDIQNLSGVTQSINAGLVVYEILSPKTRYVERKWERPDLYLYSKEAYSKHFPGLAYSDEDLIDKWEHGRAVFSEEVNPADKKTVQLRPDQFKTGVYKVELSFKDENGEELKQSRIFEVFDPAGKSVPANNAGVWVEAEKAIYEPVEKAIVHVGYAYGKACVFITVEKQGKIIREGWQEINGKYTFEVPVLESDRGGFHVHVFHPLAEKIVTATRTIQVPWSNKELTIEWQSKRDFTEPGTEETWQIKISGKGKDQVAAELLASMYDQSLDQLHPHDWGKLAFPVFSPRNGFSYNAFNHNSKGQLYKYPVREKGVGGLSRSMPDFRPFLSDLKYQFNSYMDSYPIYSRDGMQIKSTVSGAARMEDGIPPAPGAPSMADDMESAEENQAGVSPQMGDPKDDMVVSPRENLNETVFFFPDLKTDESGNILLSFKMNEALTRWRLMLYAHDKNLASAYQEYVIETRKDLMVFPNVPRFVRQNDMIFLAMKINNQTEGTLNIRGAVQVKDALTGADLSHWLEARAADRVDVPKGGSEAWQVLLKVPDDFAGLLELTYSATSGSQSDAEVHLIPVLTNRMLVTEALPLWANERESRSFEFQSYKEQAGDKSLKHQAFTLEFSPNPAWYALQALPYMVESHHKSTEHILSRYYAHAIGTKLVNQYPQVQRFFDQWSAGEDLLSNLQKNQELKSALLSETPWVLQAKNEEEQRRNLALFFNLNQMRFELSKSMKELVERQSASGGFSWFPGGRDSWYITQYVVEKLGHLDKLGVKDVREDAEIRQLLLKALSFCDGQATEHYNRIKKRVDEGKAKWTDNHLNSLIVHYMYSRSFFMDFPVSGELRKIHEFYLDQMGSHFMSLGIYEQACASLGLHRNLRAASANEISRSLLERSLYREELGRYWRLNRSWLWNEAPLETQAILIESVEEILKDRKKVDEMRRWLLKHKQTNSWPTTKSTAQAIYALLLSGTQWVSDEVKLEIKLSGQALDLGKISKSAGSAYFKIPLEKQALDPAKPVVEIKNDADHPSWGALYWQYFQDLDKIKTFSETPLKLKKEVYRKRQTSEGGVLDLINSDNKLKVGDLLTVRIILQVDRPMEFLHMKDMRASGLEPMAVVSGYQWKGGLGYYQSIRDTAVDFFFDYIGTGTYVFEYDLRVFHAGEFSNGVTTIQSMYAPEFTSHSKGIRLQIIN